MRLVILATALLSLAPVVRADSPVHAKPLIVDERGITIGRGESLPHRTYAWQSWLLGDDDVHVLVTESNSLDRPAHYQGFDNKGQQLWESEQACPNFDDFTAIFAVEGRIVCKWQKQVIAIDLKTGKEAWRFSDPRPMYITAGAQDRVAVSIANEQLAVLDAKDGHEVMRLDTDGAVLETVAATKNGPLAMLVWDTPGREKETIELPTGEAGRLEKIELSGDDPNRKLVALALREPPSKEAKAGQVVPMQPLWTTPFGGYSFDVTPSAGVVVGIPRENVRACWDLADGKLLWERPIVEGEMMWFGEDGAAFARPDASGNYEWGALDPRTLTERWKKALAPGDKPMAGGQGGGDLGLISAGAFTLVRYSDGKERYAMPVEAGIELSNLRSTKSSLMWLTSKDTERWLRFKTLAPM